MKRAERARLWTRRMAAWKASGLTIKAFCERESLVYWTFKGWRQRLRKAGLKGVRQRGARLVPITMGPRVQERAALLPVLGMAPIDPMEVRLRGARTLVLTHRFDEGALARVIRLLESL